MKKSIYISLILICSCFIATAQQRTLREADNAFDNGNYVEAIKLYKKLVETESSAKLKSYTFEHIAESYYNMNQYANAIEWYEHVVFKGNEDQKIILDYGNALIKNNDYQKAIEIFQRGLRIHKNNSLFTHKINTCRFYLSKKSNQTFLGIKNLDEINTSYSEYAPAIFEDKIVFTSSRLDKTNNKIDGRTNQAYSDFYTSTFDWETESWEEVINGPKSLNYDYNDGTFTFDPSTQTAYFMRCNKKNRQCKIMSSNLDLFGKWSSPEEVGFCTDNFSYGHPSITQDGKILYFSADLPNGYGGKDIWKIKKIEDDLWGIPENLGPDVNSASDELFPSILGDSVLFFASERYTGYGGLDLYVSKKNNNTFHKAILLNRPVNSYADDFSIVIKKDLIGGYFASNRQNQTKSDDIFEVDKYPLSIKVHGYIKDLKTDRPVSDVKISFSSEEFGADTIQCSRDGYYEYEISPYIEYALEVEKDFYIEESNTLSVFDGMIIYTDSSSYKKDFYISKYAESVAISGKVTNRETGLIMPNERLTMVSDYGRIDTAFTNNNGIYTFKRLKPETRYTIRISKDGFFSESRVCKLPKDSGIKIFSKANGYDCDFELTQIKKEKEFVISNILYDFDKASLREESKVELNKLASMMLETPGIKIQINSHTDSRGSNSYNDKLSAKRAASVVNYLKAKGINQSRLLSKGHGKRKLLIKKAKTEYEHQMNRRTSFEIISVDESIIYSNKTVSKTENNSTEQISFRIQVLVSSTKFDPNIRFANLLSIPNTELYIHKQGEISKYEIGSRSKFSTARILKKQISDMGYKDCFITAYKGNQKIKLSEAKMYLGL